MHFYSHDYNNGLKLMEHSWLGNTFVNAVCSELVDTPNRLVWCGIIRTSFQTLKKKTICMVSWNRVTKKGVSQKTRMTISIGKTIRSSSTTTRNNCSIWERLNRRRMVGLKSSRSSRINGRKTHSRLSTHINPSQSRGGFFFVNFSLCNGNFFILRVLTHGENIQAFQ